MHSAPTNLFSMPELASDPTLLPTNVFLYPYHSPSVALQLIQTARTLVDPRGRGIYATDESPDTIEMVFSAAMDQKVGGNTRSEEEMKDWRKRWRECAYVAAPSEYISGVILYSETLLDFKFAAILSNKGIIPGIRAHGEPTPIPNSPFEFRVEGLDDLLPKLQAARAAGARFSKWRVQIACTSLALGLPSMQSLEIQAETLAQYAAISQQAGLVPIVEPDVEFSADADLARSTEIHEKAISLIYTRCIAHGVLLEGSLIKPSFPQPGLDHPSREQVTPTEIALATATMLSRSVPPAVPGVVFLSGGLPSLVATAYLAAVNHLVNASPSSSPFSRLPRLTFSFGRALQSDAIKHWVHGDEQSARESIEKWSRACWLAVKGESEAP